MIQNRSSPNNALLAISGNSGAAICCDAVDYDVDGFMVDALGLEPRTR
ncbi:hypothetical protein [Sphingomonas aquatica]